MASITVRRTQGVGLILLAFVAFISLGLPDGLLGVAWPSIRADFQRPLDSLGLLMVSSTIGYLTSSFFSGRIMARMGVGMLLAASCFATGCALLAYTLVPSWWLMVAFGVLLDALLVRSVLVPALPLLIGRRIWWAIVAPCSTRTLAAVATGSSDNLVARAYRDGRLVSIGGGADEVMLEVIGRSYGL